MKSEKFTWILWVIVGIVAIAFLYPVIDWLIVAVLGLFGAGAISSKNLTKTKQTLEQQAQQAQQKQQDLKKMDKEIAEKAEEVQHTTTEHQQLFITVSGKVAEEREQLEQVKQQIQEHGGYTEEEAAQYLKNVLREGSSDEK